MQFKEKLDVRVDLQYSFYFCECRVCCDYLFSDERTRLRYRRGGFCRPPGTNLALLYFQHSTRDSLYANGNKLPGNNKLDADIAILRGVHWFKLGDYTALNQVILPFGTLREKAARADWVSPMGLLI